MPTARVCIGWCCRASPIDHVTEPGPRPQFPRPGAETAAPKAAPAYLPRAIRGRALLAGGLLPGVVAELRFYCCDRNIAGGVGAGHR